MGATRILSIAAAWLVTGCGSQPPVPSAPPTSVMIRAAIPTGAWATVLLLDSVLPMDARLSRSITVAETTVAFIPHLSGAARSRPAHQAVVSLLSAPNRRIALPVEMFAALGVSPVSQLPRISRFNSKVVLSVSAAGYSADSSCAAVYWEFFCGGMCAGGNLSILTRGEAGAWKLLQTVNLWQS